MENYEKIEKYKTIPLIKCAKIYMSSSKNLTSQKIRNYCSKGNKKIYFFIYFWVRQECTSFLRISIQNEIEDHGPNSSK